MEMPLIQVLPASSDNAILPHDENELLNDEPENLIVEEIRLWGVTNKDPWRRLQRGIGRRALAFSGLSGVFSPVFNLQVPISKLKYKAFLLTLYFLKLPLNIYTKYLFVRDGANQKRATRER